MKPGDTAAAILTGRDVDENDMYAYWHSVNAGERPKTEIVSVLAVLAVLPPSTTKMRSFVRFVRDAYPPEALPAATNAVNIVGTGGGRSTFNISTTAAFVVAAAGGRVLKSGSSAYSSSVGSADILTALGLVRSFSDGFVNDMLAETGLAFAAPQRYASICKRLAISAMPLNFKIVGRFVNTLGPLICPYDVRANIIGASTPALMAQIDAIAGDLGLRVMTAHSEIGVDEFLSIGNTQWKWADEDKTHRFSGPDNHLCQGGIDALAGGDLSANVDILTKLLQGKGSTIATETVAVNAGAALYAAGHVDDIAAGVHHALECIRDGAPFDKLEQARAFVAAHRARPGADLAEAVA